MMILNKIRIKMEELDFSSQNPATSNILSLAARKNDANNVARLLKKMNPNLVDNRGWTCLHEAAYYDSYESLVLILKSPLVRGLAETHEGHTALYLACKNNCSLKTVKALLDSVEDIANYGSTEGVTPLHIASSNGNMEILNLLLEYGAMMDVQDFDGDTPLHEAVLAAQHAAVVTLLYAGADPEIPNIPGRFTAFHLACCKGYFPVVDSLFSFVSDINQPTGSGNTSLHYALHTSAAEVVYFLLKNGADPNIKNNNGELPLELALNETAEVFLKLLSVTDRSKISRKLFIEACKPHKFQFHILEALLNSDLEPEFFNVPTPFNTDLFRGGLTRITYITHAPLNHFIYITGYIFKKSHKQFYELFYLLLMKGVDVNAYQVTECPPLVYTHYIHHMEYLANTLCFNEVFEILIEHGCDVDFCTAGKNSGDDTCIPDAFLTSIDIYPQSAPLMMPYSLYNEPNKYLQFAIKNNILDMVPLYIQSQLMAMIDKSFVNITAENLEYHVPSLKHLCRYRIRRYLRNMARKRKDIIEFTTTTFIRAINRLPVPTIIKNYLRYIEN